METISAKIPSQPEIAARLRVAESLVAQGLIAINQGLRQEAIQDLYAASCVLEDVRIVLESPTHRDEI